MGDDIQQLLGLPAELCEGILRRERWRTIHAINAVFLDRCTMRQYMKMYGEVLVERWNVQDYMRRAFEAWPNDQ